MLTHFGRPYYGWVLVATLGITETISWGILYYSFSVFLPAMEADLGWSRGEMSGAFALATLMNGLCAAPVGKWLDGRGPRLLMSLGSVAGSLLILAWGRVETLSQFYLLWALIGVVSSATLYEPAFAVVTMWFERKRARALTAVTLMAGFASTIFLPLEAWLIQEHGWRMALTWLAVLLAATTIAPHALVLRHRPEDLGLQVDGAAAPPRPRAVAGAVGGVSFRSALADPAFRWLALAFSLSTLVAFGMHVHLPSLLLDRGFDVTFAATMSGLVGAMQVAGRILLGAAGDRLHPRYAAATALGIQPLALVTLMLVPGTVGAVLAIILFGAAKGALTLIRPSVLASLYGRNGYATIAGAMASCVIVGNALGPIAAGSARDYSGSYDSIIWVFIVLAVISALVVLRSNGQPGHPIVDD